MMKTRLVEIRDRLLVEFGPSDSNASYQVPEVNPGRSIQIVNNSPTEVTLLGKFEQGSSMTLAPSSVYTAYPDVDGTLLSILGDTETRPDPRIKMSDDGTSSVLTVPVSVSSFIPGQTAGVPDTATLTVVAGVGTNRVALPTGTAFRLDWSGFGPFAFRFGTVASVAVDTDFPGVVGLPQYFVKPAGTTHIIVYGIGGGTLKVSGGAQP